MRFLLVASFPESLVNFRGALIRDLIRAGLEVHVAAPDIRSDRDVCDALISWGAEVHEIPLDRASTNPVRDLRLCWSLYRLIKRVSPDYFLGYTIKPVIFGSTVGWLCKVPHRFALVTGLGYAFTGDRGGLVPSIVRRMYRFALARAHKVFFQNPDDQRLFVESDLLPSGVPSCVVNGSGVDLTEFSEVSQKSGDPGFLMIARLLGDKGVREYAHAAEIVHERNPDARFALAGWIDENPNLISESELDNWTNGGYIEFLGRLDDVRDAIADSTVYVLPSYREGTPRTVLEAMAMGRPIITTDAPGCRETVVDGENGFLVPVKSVDALVQAMQKFIDEPELAAKMGRRSREIAEQKYDVREVNAVMLREMGIV